MSHLITQQPKGASNITKSKKLIVVSNRLPVTAKKEADGSISFTRSSGGLVTGLTATGLDFTWIGWLGREIAEDQQQEYVEKLREQKCVPVFIKDAQADPYYNGFSNSILWPLFHYLFERKTNFNKAQWLAYQQVNEEFAKVISTVHAEMKQSSPNDQVYIWVHDYHLMTLPKLLRKTMPEARIGFFLHIPFPAAEIYRTFPARAEILDGLLGCNIVGFHTYEYARHFMESCTRTLGCDTSPTGVNHKGHFISVGVFPIGVDPVKFTDCLALPDTTKRLQDFKRQYEGKKVIVGVDRVDYTKGLPHKLQAFEQFLELFPERQHDTVLLQVGVPSREDVQEYQDLISEVNQLVGKINSKYGTLTSGFPIHYINKSVEFPDLCALYRLADVCLITPIRDGMNLVAYEYVACQKDAHGTLVLSEFAGAANSLSGSILINPFDTENTAKRLNQALCMDDEERRTRFERNHLIVFEKNTATEWGKRFMEEFKKACKRDVYLTPTPELNPAYLLSRYKAAKKQRVLILDYDGTLVPIKYYPNVAPPSQRLKDILRALSSNKNTKIFIVSGRNRENMETLLGDIPGLTLCAEHGAIVRHAHTTEWVPLFTDIDRSWIDLVRSIFEYQVERTPGAYFEEKETSVIMSFKDVEPFYGDWKAKQLVTVLQGLTAALPTEVRMISRSPSTTPSVSLSELASGSAAMTMNSGSAATGNGSISRSNSMQGISRSSSMQGINKKWLRGSGAAGHMESLSSTEIVLGHKLVEIRTSNCNKGTAIKKLLDLIEGSFDVVICIGDDKQDEDMFEVLNAHLSTNNNSSSSSDQQQQVTTITCLVGPPNNNSKAQFMLSSPDSVVGLMQLMIEN